MATATIAKQVRKGIITVEKNELLKKMLRKNHFRVFSENEMLFEQNNQYHLLQFEEEDTFTAQEYFSLPENIPLQLLYGKYFIMASPTITHQDILLELATEIKIFLRINSLGKVIVAPADVYFSEETVAQPDILFVSKENLEIVGEKRVNGSPDFIVEILSSNVKDDRITKMKLYGEENVKEYWIVNPEDKTIEIFTNNEGKMQVHATLQDNEIAKSEIIKGFEIELKQLFK